MTPHLVSPWLSTCSLELEFQRFRARRARLGEHARLLDCGINARARHVEKARLNLDPHKGLAARDGGNACRAAAHKGVAYTVAADRQKVVQKGYGLLGLVLPLLPQRGEAQHVRAAYAVRENGGIALPKMKNKLVRLAELSPHADPALIPDQKRGRKLRISRPIHNRIGRAVAKHEGPASGAQRTAHGLQNRAKGRLDQAEVANATGVAAPGRYLRWDCIGRVHDYCVEARKRRQQFKAIP